MELLIHKLDNFLLFPFGSHYLGTSTDDSDIDILCGCLGGDNIDTCIEILKDVEDVEIVAKVPSYIPLLKLIVKGIPVDITFATLTEKCHRQNLMDFIEPTENNARAVNGVFVSDFLRESVSNWGLFTEVVKRVKKWATERKIYGSMLGFPGGMAWTLMVAKIFQLGIFNHFTPVDEAFNKFLWIYKYWKWPAPIVICEKYEPEGGNKYKNWNPLKYPKDYCFMAVITPVYPTMNSTYSVNEATLKVIQREIDLTLFKSSNLDRNYTIIELKIPENDDGSFRLKLKGMAAKLNSIDGVEYAHPFLDGESEAHKIGINCSKSVDITNIFEDFEIANLY